MVDYVDQPSIAVPPTILQILILDYTENFAHQVLLCLIHFYSMSVLNENIFKELEKEGVPKEALDKVHSAIGIQLGGKEPAEIALSILAEIVKVKNEVFG